MPPVGNYDHDRPPVTNGRCASMTIPSSPQRRGIRTHDSSYRGREVRGVLSGCDWVVAVGGRGPRPHSSQWRTASRWHHWWRVKFGDIPVPADTGFVNRRPPGWCGRRAPVPSAGRDRRLSFPRTSPLPHSLVNRATILSPGNRLMDETVRSAERVPQFRSRTVRVTAKVDGRCRNSNSSAVFAAS